MARRVTDEIEGVVQEIRRACAERGEQVSEILAAFIVQSVIKANPRDFSPTQPLESDTINRLIRLAIDRLIERDSPTLETIKLQVGFDSSYVQLEEQLVARTAHRNIRLTELQRTIINVVPRGSSDFETLTALYRQIFSFLIAFYDAGGDTKNRNVEREVAAALESVFPRIGLKSFVLLGQDEKKAQLDEMAKIVLGIRLFNREMGKGGAGLPSVEHTAWDTAQDLKEMIEDEVRAMQDVCLQYQETIVFALVREPPGVNSRMVQRWKDELSNRRQYLSYLQSLQEDVAVTLHKVRSERETFVQELKELESLVGGRSSVPKEQVYPKFEIAAAAWMNLVEQDQILEVRKATLDQLHEHARAFISTLNADSPIVQAAQAENAKVTQSDEEAEAAALARAQRAAEAKAQDDAQGAAEAAAAKAGAGDDGPAPGPAHAAEAKDDTGTIAVSVAAGGPGAKGGAGFESASSKMDDGWGPGEAPVRLSVDSTPEFMQLPLEYQGFCPWTMVHRGGLLLPGKPALGVVRFANLFFVFAHTVALEAFLENPNFYRRGVKDLAVQAPELIHLLRLQADFPSASITGMLKARSTHAPAGGALGAGGGGGAAGLPAKRDASTETPTHFVEKHIDVNYEWNEWALRRRALRMVNLRKCATTSQQTDMSHYRRENDSQVYLPRQSETQTMRDSGTNPPQITRYAAGLRGTPLGPMPSRFAHQSTGKPGVLNLVLEPGAKEGHLVIGGRSNAF